jgi:Ca-activated chloride channel family protein
MSKHLFKHMIECEESRTPVNASLKEKLAQDLNLSSSTNKQKTEFRRSHFFSWPVMGVVGALLLMLVISTKPTSTVPSLLGLAGTDDWIYSTDHKEEDVFQRASNLASSVGASAALTTPGKSFGAQLASELGLGSAAALSAPSAQPMQRAKSVQANDLAAGALGYSVGGAKDIGNFRENIKNGYLPLSSDLTYEGLFYDYSFDTGIQKPCTELFCPSYTRAVTRDPQTGAEEYFLSVGLNSNIKESDFHRPKTNFVVVLDISGSMGESFDQYYYDGMGKRVEIPAKEAGKTKMELASEALSLLVDQLKPDDRLGVVLFSDSATIAKPLSLVGNTDRVRLKQHLMELQPTNGTNMSEGLKAGAALLQDQTEKDGYANRMIFITDAMPNNGEFGASGLAGLVQQNQNKGINMTMIGIGVDFQTQLVEAMTKVRGANYLSIHSAEEFKQRLGEQFDFLVTPLVYDLKLNLEGSGFAIEKVYGSPDVDLSSGNIMHVRTLFPSKTENGETRGGIVLLKLKKLSEQPTITLRASYDDTNNQSHQSEEKISFGDMHADAYDNLGIRKGVVLARYGELMKNWLVSEGGQESESVREQWERTSRPLHVSASTQASFTRFSEYFRTEASVINDKTLEQEQRVLDLLIKATPTETQPVDDWMKISQ